MAFDPASLAHCPARHRPLIHPGCVAPQPARHPALVVPHRFCHAVGPPSCRGGLKQAKSSAWATKAWPNLVRADIGQGNMNYMGQRCQRCMARCTGWRWAERLGSPRSQARLILVKCQADHGRTCPAQGQEAVPIGILLASAGAWVRKECTWWLKSCPFRPSPHAPPALYWQPRQARRAA